MLLFVGLGNPGNKYLLTRHNLGFMVADELSEIHQIRITKRKADALIGEGKIAGMSVVLAKPQAFMNLSGSAVRVLSDFYKADVADLIVIHDDLDLDPGAIRVKFGGGTGGHKGLKSIMDHLGRPDFVRIRIGIGKPAMPQTAESYVLEKFAKTDLEKTAETVHRACDAVEEIISAGIQSAMNRFNPRNRLGGQTGGQGESGD